MKALQMTDSRSGHVPVWLSPAEAADPLQDTGIRAVWIGGRSSGQGHTTD